MKLPKYNLKYLLVFGIFLLVVLIGYVRPEFSTQNACINPASQSSTAIKNVIPEISSDEKYYRVYNLLNSARGDFYRVTFETRSNQGTFISLKLTSAFEKEFLVSSFSIMGTEEDYIPKEIIFRADGFYKDLIFEKKGSDDSKIFIKNIHLSRLNVASDYETRLLKPTISGYTHIKKSPTQQIQKEEKYFSQLRGGGTKLGQIFKAEDDLLAGVSFDIKNNGSEKNNKYRLELRDVKETNGKFSLGSTLLASLEFTQNDLEQYTTVDGEIRFPLASFLEKDRLYFIGIDNSSAKNNFFNYLELKGTSDIDAYQKGSGVVYQKQGVEEIGDIFFALYTTEFTRNQNEKILTGSRIEDTGRGEGVYTYQSSGRTTDLLDLFSYDKGNVWFNGYEGIISGSPQNNTSYTYKISTPYAFKQAQILAEQMYEGWYRINIHYSFDNQNWTSLPDTGEEKSGTVQRFDSVVLGDGNQKDLYIKVTYDGFDNKEIKLFGLRHFKVVEDLIIK